MATIDRLSIRQYRNLRAPCEMRFSPAHNIVLGKNGTGKTTLLELIATILSGNFTSIRQEGFDLGFTLDGGDEGQVDVDISNHRVEQPASPIRLPTGVGGELDWALAFSIKIAIPEGKFVIEHSGGSTTIEVAGITTEAAKLDFKPDSFPVMYAIGAARQHAVQDDAKSRLVRLLFKTLHFAVSRFDESLDYLRRMTTGTVIDLRQDANGNITPTTMTGSLAPAISTQLLKFVRAEPNRPTFSFSLADSGPHLARAVELLGFKSGMAVLDCIEKTATKETPEWKLGDLRFFFQRTDGSLVHHSLLSYGEKRLFSFLYYMQCCEGVALVDELVNGLHHSMIRSCLASLSGLQSFLTSQNPLLLDFLEFKTREDVVRSFVVCRCDQAGTREWSGISETDASNVHVAYQTGIQTISEILRANGLW